MLSQILSQNGQAVCDLPSISASPLMLWHVLNSLGKHSVNNERKPPWKDQTPLNS